MSTTPRYVNGIPVRTIGGDDYEDHQEDFEEEVEGRRGILTVAHDGFTFRQGSDIICHMDKRGGLHPRRYIILFDIGFNTDDDNSYSTVNLIVCEEGPRISLSFPEIGPITQSSNWTNLKSISKKLPVRLCPVEERGYVTGFCLADYIISGTASQMITTVTMSPEGDISFLNPNSVTQVGSITIKPFNFSYDTGRY